MAMIDDTRSTRKATSNASVGGGDLLDSKYGGSGGNGGNAARQARRQMRKANRRNRKREKEIRAGYDERMNAAGSAFDGLGASEINRINQERQRDLASSQQNFTGRGLSGTTLGQSAANAINQVASQNISRVNEGVQLGRFNAMDQIRNERLGFVERIEDIGPNMQQFLNLMMQLGAGGAR